MILYLFILAYTFYNFIIYKLPPERYCAIVGVFTFLEEHFILFYNCIVVYTLPPETSHLSLA